MFSYVKKKRNTKKKSKVLKKKESTKNGKKIAVKKHATTKKKNLVVKRKKDLVKYLVEETVVDIRGDILESTTKRSNIVVGGKKLPQIVRVVPLDNVSFHYKENVLKWKYIFH